MFRTYLISGLLLVFTASLAEAQTCPAASDITAATAKATEALLEDPVSFSGEERARLSGAVRANTILLWDLKGIEGLRQAKGGLTMLTSCISNGGCGFAKPTPDEVTGLYDFINNKRSTLPATLKSPPQTAVQWAKDKLGCTNAPAPTSQALTSVSTVRRPVPTLVPDTDEGKRQLEATQNAIRMIDGFCHGEPVSGRAENCMKLGSSFDRGIQGFEYDAESAKYYFRQACHEGAPMGCYNFGANLRDYGKTQADKDLGAEYVGKACDLGNEMACFNFKAWTGNARVQTPD